MSGPRQLYGHIYRLGYWAESGDASLCTSGLAWLAAGHVELPSGGAHEPLRCGPIAALRQLGSDSIGAPEFGRRLTN